MTHSAFLVLAASRRLRPDKVGLGVKEAENDEGFITHADGSVSKKPSGATQEAGADAGVWQIVKGFLSGGSEAELQAAAPVWMVAHAMAGISPSMAGAVASLIDARGELDGQQLSDALSRWRCVAEIMYNSAEKRQAAAMCAPSLGPGESPRRSERAKVMRRERDTAFSPEGQQIMRVDQALAAHGGHHTYGRTQAHLRHARHPSSTACSPIRPASTSSG